MEGKELAEFKNRVLEFMVSMGNNTMGVDLLYNRIPNPFDNSNELLEVLIAMTEEAPEYFDFDQNNYPPDWFGPNGLTQRYLDKGGFVNQYESDREADIEALKLAAQEQGIKDLQERNLTLSNQVASMRLKTYWIPLIISGISAIIAGLSLWYAVSTSSNSVSATELQTVRDDIKGLRDDFKKENDVLKDRLYELDSLP